MSKFLTHIQEGTLLAAIRRKLGLGGGLNADPDHYHGDTAKNYLDKRLKQEMWHDEQSVVEQLLSEVPDGSSVLDVAIGTGRFVEMYLRKNMSVHGIDISKDMLDAAREALGPAFDRCHIDQGSAEALPYRDGQFNLVVCFRFFGLIPLGVGRKVLSEIHRVCNDRVIIRVPVRKDTAPSLPAPADSDAIQGRLYERELFDLFNEYGFVARKQLPVGEKSDVIYNVYVLHKTASA